ncbi:MAG: hypothetical protein NVS3B20_14540 [Polyangiales bacterium]
MEAIVRSVTRFMAPILFLQGCMATLPAPPKPEAVVPTLGVTPDAPPPEGSGRLLVDVASEPAKVSRVVDTVDNPDPYSNSSLRRGMPSESGMGFGYRKLELLCISPCVIDIRPGAHTLVFTSLVDPTHTSSADVVVSAQPSVVRHALGRDKGYSNTYLGGAGLALVGGGVTLMGALATTVGLVAKSPRDDPSGRPNGDGNPQGLLVVGLVMMGIGLALGTTGYFVAASDRPIQQQGSTIQWSPAGGIRW